MAYTIGRAETEGWSRPADLDQRLAAADIRFATIVRRPQIPPALRPPETTALRRATGATVRDVSALCLFTALEIAERENRPVEFIVSAVGGSSIEAWLPITSIKDLGLIEEDHQRYFADWIALGLAWQQRVGMILNALPPPADASSVISVPGSWEDQGHVGLDGVVRLESHFALELDNVVGDATLSLGLVDDWDTAFVNDCEVGATYSWDIPRNYMVPRDCLRSGLNTLRVRVVDTGGGGGIVGQVPTILVSTAAGAETIPVDGKWRMSAAGPVPTLPMRPGTERTTPSLLFNEMVAPLANEQFDGVVWYQGENNAYPGDGPSEYARKLTALVAAWRGWFGAPELPFYIIQLPEFDPGADTGPHAFGNIRLGQFLVSEALPNVHLVPAIGLGSLDNIHPPDKTVLASRVADAILGDLESPEDCHLVKLTDGDTTAGLTLEYCDTSLSTCEPANQSAMSAQELSRLADHETSSSLVIGRANVPSHWLSCRKGALAAQRLRPQTREAER